MRFEQAEVDNTHPFVAEALRKRGRNEECWCRSGKKYKHCHWGRENKAKIPIGQALQINHHLFSQKRCMHPNESECSGPRIKAHTIQRKGGLKHIVDAKNHVLMMPKNAPGSFEPEPIGWKDASTFYGFCSFHDSETFKKIETQDFTATSEQCFLFYYRALCYELYQKEALIEIFKNQKETLDNGFPLDRQIEIQLSLSSAICSFSRTVSELQAEKKEADQALEQKQYLNHSHVIIYFSGKLDLFTTSHFHLAYDLGGTKIYDINDEAVFGEGASFSIAPIDEKTGALIVSWNKQYLHILTFIKRFLKIDKKLQLNLLHQLLFAQSENICFSQEWWDTLDETQKSFVKRLYSFGGDNYGYELEPEIKLHRWTLGKIEEVNT